MRPVMIVARSDPDRSRAADLLRSRGWWPTLEPAPRVLCLLGPADAAWYRARGLIVWETPEEVPQR